MILFIISDILFILKGKWTQVSGDMLIVEDLGMRLGWQRLGQVDCPDASQ